MKIEIVEEAGVELAEAFQRLTPQLSADKPPPTLDELTALVKSACSTLVVARTDDGFIVGALCLTVYRVPTGIRSIIEDVVVDAGARRQGIGEALMLKALEAARERGAAQVALTSNPAREAANRLYQRLGFTKRSTNAYIYKF
jgi:ribosomal protein S18 acetylase RimI-like enzyme